MKYPDISKAVEQEILASYDKLYRLAFSYVKNEQDAMDVVQESVYKAMKNASQIKEKKYVRALEGYYGEILLVGISYDKETRKHGGEIEVVIEDKKGSSPNCPR